MKEIVLVRHGKMAVSTDPVSGRDIGEWMRRYDDSGIAKDLAPPESLRSVGQSVSFVMASDLRRSIESAAWLSSPEKVRVDPDLREAVLPESMGVSLRLSPTLWKMIARAAWSLNWVKSSEPIDATRQRASRATDRLCAMSAEHDVVVVVAHKTFNHFLAGQLLKRGWRGPRFWSGAYWGTARFVRQAES